MLFDPGVVEGHVVGNEIEHQPQSAPAKTLAQPGQSGVAAHFGR
jgi:hypothetical protein